MAVFGAYLWITASPWGSDAVLGPLIIVFSLGTLGWLAKVFWDRRPVVEVGALGIRDRRFSDQFIPWGTITGIKGYGTWNNRYLRWLGTLVGVRGPGNQFVGVIVKDPHRFYHPPNPIVRVINRWVSHLLGYPLLSVNMGALDGSYQDLSEAILGFAEGKRIDIDL